MYTSTKPSLSKSNALQPQAQPERALFVIAHGLSTLVPVGNVHVNKAVVIEVKRAATPGPAGAGYRGIERRWFKSTSRCGQQKPVAVRHARTKGVVDFKTRACQTQMFKTVRRR